MRIIAFPMLRARLESARLVGLLACLAGVAATGYYFGLDLTLSHYDARGHLVVARRVVDNLTPGWMQLGAVWLPLPHLINIVPAQIDWNFQTGLLSTAWSVAAMAFGLSAVASLIRRHTGSPATAVLIPLLVLLNPSVLYLQSTPMTEPLLFGLAFLAVAAVDRWLDDPRRTNTHWAGLVLAALVLTRYEGWAIAGTVCAVALAARPRAAARLIAWPLTAILAFLFLSYGSTGRWFVTSGFFEATNPALDRPLLALGQVALGAIQLSHPLVLLTGLAGAAALLHTAWRQRADGRIAVLRPLLPLALAAAAALPVYAFSSGHPVRVRYMVASVVALTTLTGFALTLLPERLRTGVAVLFAATLLWLVPPLDGDAPMVREAQWERPYGVARRVVTQALADAWDGRPVLASMGSLAHYMQQMNRAGFDLRDFLHEGNGDLWKSAVRQPRIYVDWILIEQSAEGGDELARRAREQPGFLDGFERIAEGGGVALYRMTAAGDR